MRRYADMGYTKFKMKIGGAPLGEDMNASRRRWRWSAMPTTSRSTPMAASTRRPRSPTARRWPPFGLRWYEEPGDPLDYQLMSELGGVYPRRWRPARTCSRAATSTISSRFGGMRKGQDLFQMDPALSYGLGEFQRMIAPWEGRAIPAQRSSIRMAGT